MVSYEDKLDQLLSVGFPRHVAEAWLRAKGRCEYCHRDLVVDRLGYAVQETDHLLPQSKRKYAAFNEDVRNAVLSCRLCNGIKSDFDPLECGECAETMLAKRRDELIDRSRNRIAHGRKCYDRQWRRLREVVLGFGGEVIS